MESGLPPNAPANHRAGPLFPGLRAVAVVWLVVYVPAYSLAYGPANFLFLCNLGVMLTAMGWMFGSRLLVSSQAVAAPVIGLAWALDAGWRLVSGEFLYGATAYMWDPQYPLFTRLLSLYHVVWPILVVASVAKVGYDRRGWLLQTGIAFLGLVVARWATPPEANVNFAFQDPIWGRQIGPGPVHLIIVLAVLSGVAYGLTHALLSRTLPEPRSAPRSSGLSRAQP